MLRSSVPLGTDLAMVSWAALLDTASVIAVQKPSMMMLAIILLPRFSAMRVAGMAKWSHVASTDWTRS